LIGIGGAYYTYVTAQQPSPVVYSPYIPIKTFNGEQNDWTRAFVIKIGCNINTIPKEDEAPAAYEAPKSSGPDLQHALAGDFHLSPFLTRIGATYDLRWRRENKVDYALDLGLGWGTGSYFTYQALAIFGEGKGAMEAGLSGITLRYPGSTAAAGTAIGIPIGFRVISRAKAFISEPV
jgi:hypothetical protein